MSHNGNTALMEALYDEAYEEAEEILLKDVEPSDGPERYPMSTEEFEKFEHETAILAEKIARKKFEDSEFSGNDSWSLS